MLLQSAEEPFVGVQGGGGGLREQLVQPRIIGDDTGLDHRGTARWNITLGQLAVGEVPVPDQLVGEAAGNPGDVHGHCGVLQHGQMPDIEDVPQVAGVRGGGRIRLRPALVAGSAGELRQGLATVRIGGPVDVGRWGELRLGDNLHAHAPTVTRRLPPEEGASAPTRALGDSNAPNGRRGRPTVVDQDGRSSPSRSSLAVGGLPPPVNPRPPIGTRTTAGPRPRWPVSSPGGAVWPPRRVPGRRRPGSAPRWSPPAR